MGWCWQGPGWGCSHTTFFADHKMSCWSQDWWGGHTLFSSSDHSCCEVVAACVSMAYHDLTGDNAVLVERDERERLQCSSQGVNPKHGTFGSMRSPRWRWL